TKRCARAFNEWPRWGSEADKFPVGDLRVAFLCDNRELHRPLDAEHAGTATARHHPLAAVSVWADWGGVLPGVRAGVFADGDDHRQDRDAGGLCVGDYWVVAGGDFHGLYDESDSIWRGTVLSGTI